jgi:hypothetical protein
VGLSSCCVGAVVPSLLHGRASASLFVGVVRGRGEMTWPGPPSSVWWCRVSWVGRMGWDGMGWDGMEGTHHDDDGNYSSSSAIVVPRRV